MAARFTKDHTYLATIQSFEVEALKNTRRGVVSAKKQDVWGFIASYYGLFPVFFGVHNTFSK